MKEMFQIKQITRDQILNMLKADRNRLFKMAFECREYNLGNYFDTCSIVNAKSGNCSEDCKWCAQSGKHNSVIEKYPLVDERSVIQRALFIQSKGIKRFSLVTSGKRLNDDQVNKVSRLIQSLRNRTDLHLCGSFGLLDKSQLEKLKAAGLQRYHCNLETSASFFINVCTSHSYEEKIQTIIWAREVGLDLCSGLLMGMGESMSDRIDLAYEFNRLGILSIPINILNPIPGTQFENLPVSNEIEILDTLATFRLINPRAYIRLAGGRSLIDGLLMKAIAVGVNASILGELLTTSGSEIDDDIATIKHGGMQINNDDGK